MLKKIFAVLMASVISLSLAACGGSSTNIEYDAEEICAIFVSGKNGEGSLSTTINKTVTTPLAMGFDKEGGFTAGAEVSQLFESMKFEADKSEGLSSGDTVKIELASYNKDLAKQYGIGFTNTSFTYTVEDLADLETVDPFEGLEVSFTGVSPLLSVEFDTSDCHPTVKDLVKFSADIPNREIANGDTVTITVEFDEDRAYRNNVTFVSGERQFIPAGFSEYPVTLKGVDISSVVEALEEALQKNIEMYNWRGDWSFITTVGDSKKAWDYMNETTVAKAYLLDGPRFNGMSIIYQVDTTAKADGETRSSTDYMIVTVKMITVLDNVATCEGKASVSFDAAASLEKAIEIERYDNSDMEIIEELSL